MREVLPYLTTVFVPPNWDERYTTAYGFTLEDIYSFGMRSVEAKWRAIGYPLDEMPPGVYPFDPAMPHRERAERQIKLLKAGVLAEPGTSITATPEVQQIYFDVVARSARTDAVDRPTKIQWRFSDAEPFHVVIDNGSSRAERGLAPDADLTLETSWADWIRVAMRGESPAKAMLQRRLRPRGSLRQLARLGRIWEPRRTG